MSYVIIPPLSASSNSDSSNSSNKSEPELELHSDDGRKENEKGDAMHLCKQVEEHRDQIATLQSLIKHQGSTILQLRRMELQHLRGLHDDCKYDDEEDDYVSDHGGEDDSNSSFEFSSPFVFGSPPRAWSETLDSGSKSLMREWQYHDCFTPPTKGTRGGTVTSRIKMVQSSDLHDSIEAIREEASRVDTVMALNQLDTMRQELDTIKRELHNRGSQVKELHALVSLKDDRLSVLELERDLYKADVTRMQMDRQYNNKKSGSGSNIHYTDSKSSSSSSSPTVSSHLQNNNGGRIRGQGVVIMDSPNAGTSIKKNGHVILDDISEASTVIRLPALQPTRPVPIFRPTTRTTTMSTCMDGSTKSSQKALLTSTDTGRRQRDAGSIEDTSSVSMSHQSGQSRDSQRRQQPQPQHQHASHTKEASKSCLSLPEASKSCLSMPKPPQFLSRRKKKASGKQDWEHHHQQYARPYHRRSPLPPLSSSSSSLSTIKLHGGISANEQADELQRLLRTSLKTADELRKRLAMLNRYYEDLVRRLNTDQQNMERDLVEQICAIELSKRRAVEDLERQLCETQAQLAIEKCFIRRIE